jgi:hypothetical protein
MRVDYNEHRVGNCPPHILVALSVAIPSALCHPLHPGMVELGGMVVMVAIPSCLCHPILGGMVGLSGMPIT